MGAEHSHVASSSPAPSRRRHCHHRRPTAAWQQLDIGLQYKPTDVAVWPQFVPLLEWFTAHDVDVLLGRLRRRARTQLLTFCEFRTWLSPTATGLERGAGDPTVDDVLHPPPIPVHLDIMTPPSRAGGANPQQPPTMTMTTTTPGASHPRAAAVLVLDHYLEHVFESFVSPRQPPPPSTKRLQAIEFLAAMIVGSRAIWRLEDKLELLLGLCEDPASPTTPTLTGAERRIFKEADLALLVLSVLHGLAKLTVGLEARWRRHGLEPGIVARRVASACLRFALARRPRESQSVQQRKVFITLAEVRAFWAATPSLRRILALFSAEEVRNPFTFGVSRCPSDGRPLSPRHRLGVERQRGLYDGLLRQYVSFEGRHERRRVSAATLIQSTWRRRCSLGLLERRREAQHQQRHASAATLQGFLRQCQFARVLEQHAEAERHALNGAVLVAGVGPLAPMASSTTPPEAATRSGTAPPLPLTLVEAFKLQRAKIAAVASSRTAALALHGDRRTLFAWGRSLPQVYAEDLALSSSTAHEEDGEDQEGDGTHGNDEEDDVDDRAYVECMRLTQTTPSRLAFRFPAATPVAQLACGLRHALALTSDGNVHTWGFNDHGQLGHGSQRTLAARTNGRQRYAHYVDERDAREYEFLPRPTVLVYFQGAAAQRAEPIPVQGVVCGDYYSMALSADGDVFTWGEASEGQLGHGDIHASVQVGFVDKHMLNSAYTFLPEPEPVLALSDVPVVQVACRKNHSVALTADGRVFEWGNWGKRCGRDREHAFAPVELTTFDPEELGLRRISVGDHHIAAEGSSLWLTLSGRLDGLRDERHLYLACASGWSCGLRDIAARLVPRPWTCVLLGCDVDDLGPGIDDEPPMLAGVTAATVAGEEVADSTSTPAADDNGHAQLWQKRVAAFALREPARVAEFDATLQAVLGCFPEFQSRYSYEGLLASWFEGTVRDRLVVLPRGKPPGSYLQLLLPRDLYEPNAAEEAMGLAPMIEFPLCGASSTRRPEPISAGQRGLATHIFHAVMRDRLSSLSIRQRKAMSVDFMEPNSLFLVDFDEQSCGPEVDATELLTRVATTDGQQANEWSTTVVHEMTRRVLEAQEAGALVVLIVLDFLDADPFELELPAETGVYVPVYMIKKSTPASRHGGGGAATTATATEPRIVFGDILESFLASQALVDVDPHDVSGEERPDRDQHVPTVPAAWIARCFERVDTTARRVEAALDHGARGVVLVQDEHSLEMDGETRGAPVFLSPPSPTMAPTEHLVAMISSDDGQSLREASYLSPTSRTLPFVQSLHEGSQCELLADVRLERRAGGTTYAWGNGQHGRLGLGNPASEPFQDGYEALTDSAYRYVDRPTPIVALAGRPLRSLVCGGAHNVAVTETGGVFTWGKGAYGQLANARTKEQALRRAVDQWVPRQLHDLRYERIVDATANDTSTILLTDLVEPEIYIERRREIVQLKAAARRTLAL